MSMRECFYVAYCYYCLYMNFVNYVVVALYNLDLNAKIIAL